MAITHVMVVHLMPIHVMICFVISAVGMSPFLAIAIVSVTCHVIAGYDVRHFLDSAFKMAEEEHFKQKAINQDMYKAGRLHVSCRA